MLDKSTTPPDEFLQLGQRPAVIVVQNIGATQAPMPKRTRVVVRMVNNTAAEVMDATTLPGSVGGMNVENALSAGPLPGAAQLSATGLRGWRRLDRVGARFRCRGFHILSLSGHVEVLTRP